MFGDTRMEEGYIKSGEETRKKQESEKQEATFKESYVKRLEDENVALKKENEELKFLMNHYKVIVEKI